MRHLVFAVLLVGLAPLAAATAQTASFATDKIGSAPANWTVTKTGRGEAKWTVEADVTAPSKGSVLKQAGVATYPLALKTGTALQNGFVETKFKALAGKEDRAAGLVWRAQDANNYYVVRANALEDNVVLYKTANGQRIELRSTKGDTYGVKAPVPPNQWHTLRVDFSGSRFVVTYNGKPLFEVDDATFKGAGMVGLWTKSDSVIVFDGFAHGEAK
jgi:hypothetical protein